MSLICVAHVPCPSKAREPEHQSNVGAKDGKLALEDAAQSLCEHKLT